MLVLVLSSNLLNANENSISYLFVLVFCIFFSYWLGNEE